MNDKKLTHVYIMLAIQAFCIISLSLTYEYQLNQLNKRIDSCESCKNIPNNPGNLSLNPISAIDCYGSVHNFVELPGISPIINQPSLYEIVKETMNAAITPVFVGIINVVDNNALIKPSKLP